MIKTFRNLNDNSKVALVALGIYAVLGRGSVIRPPIDEKARAINQAFQSIQLLHTNSDPVLRQGRGIPLKKLVQ